MRVLTETNVTNVEIESATLNSPSVEMNRAVNSEAKMSPLAKYLKIEWLGQMIASLCWIVSVFVYGISSTGDWLQLSAASAWFIANIASVMNAE